MNENGLKERTPEQEHKKDIYLSLWKIQKSLRELADDVFVLYQVMEKEE